MHRIGGLVLSVPPESPQFVAGTTLALLARIVGRIDQFKRRLARNASVQQERLLNSSARSERDALHQQVELSELDRLNEELRAALGEHDTRLDALLRAEKMAALRAVVVGIAHELNTPIGNCITAASTVQNHAALFAAKADAGLSRKCLRDFANAVNVGTGILVRNLGRAADLVASFRLSDGMQLHQERRAIFLHELVGETLQACHAEIERSGCTVSCAVAATLRLDSYPESLVQVLSTLVDNALLHAFAGRQPGHIEIIADTVDAATLRLTVRDDGIGISSGNLKRVFDPFFTTRLGCGSSGLGLYIAHNIVKSVLNGRIEVHSMPNRGTSFTLILPCRAP